MSTKLLLPRGFPFRDVLNGFLSDYASCRTYWYVPKSRTLNDQNLASMRVILEIIFDEFLDQVWNQDTQDSLLDRLVQRGVLKPYVRDASLANRTALIRINKKLLEILGFLWVERERDVVITDAGFELIIADDPRPIVEAQIAKIQYPNPSFGRQYMEGFAGLLPTYSYYKCYNRQDTSH